MIKLRRIKEGESNPAIISKEEEIHDLQGQIIASKKQLTNPSLPKDDKDGINQKIKDLQLKIKDIKDDITYMKDGNRRK